MIVLYFVLALIVLRIAAGRIARWIMLKRARRWYDVIAISSIGPGGMEVHLPDEIKEVVEQVPTKEISKIAKKNRDLLLDANNPLAEDIPILQIPFQDGKWVNETWIEYQERLVSEIKSARAEWHDKLKNKATAGWYERVHHKQKYHGVRTGSKRSV
jgi:hypothetical protein